MTGAPLADTLKVLRVLILRGQFAQRSNLFDADIAGYSRDRGRGGRENF